MRSTTLLLFTLSVCLGMSYGSLDTKPGGSGRLEEGSPRPKSLIGWLSEPKTPPPSIKTKLQSREAIVTLKKVKPGFCGSPKTYGIKCMMRMDQCMEDNECPSTSKCCMIGACGYLCVKPKPTEELLVKEDVKTEIKKKDKKDSSTTEAYDDDNDSLKASDVIDMKDMKDKKDFIVSEKTDKIKDNTAINEADRDV